MRLLNDQSFRAAPGERPLEAATVEATAEWRDRPGIDSFRTTKD